MPRVFSATSEVCRGAGHTPWGGRLRRHTYLYSGTSVLERERGILPQPRLLCVGMNSFLPSVGAPSASGTKPCGELSCTKKLMSVSFVMGFFRAAAPPAKGASIELRMEMPPLTPWTVIYRPLNFKDASPG